MLASRQTFRGLCRARIWHLTLLVIQSQCEVTTIPLPRNLLCPPSQVFDFAGLRCSECDPGLEPEGTFACRCPSESLQTQEENCSLESKWQANCQDMECQSCILSSQVASLDQQHCIPCNVWPLSKESSEYDATTNDCTCDLGTHKLIEIYNSEGVPTRKDCSRCPKGTAVITKNLYEDGQQFFITAGRKYTADPYACQSCPDPHMIFNTDHSCGCADGYLLSGEASIGEQSCIRRNPSIFGSYSRVRFRDPPLFGAGLDEPNDFSLESIIFSHVYPKSAAECEYYEGSSRKSLRSCQALSNLCVMSVYDEDTAPCKQLEAISQRRLETYRNQEDWAYTLPWLYYRDKTDYITNDRGINMDISFRAKVNSVNILSFKLAKFTVNGTFVGMEDLKNQFEFCLNLLGKDDQNQWAFGRSYRNSYSCSVNSLLTKEMFLYDLYLSDESSESCSHDSVQHDCLYPVPVLNRNLIKDNKFVNVEDDVDDIYTRRFFLFDNQSGRTSSGTEALRYAKKIVLEIQTQSENPNKIYPPRLVIEYETTADGNWEKDGTNTNLLFKIEYSMKTEKFWASIQIMIGFTFALAVVILVVELNNWQSRQHSSPNSEDPRSAGPILGLRFMLHAVMIACHTFALLFSAFAFLVCTYYFIFFKLQSQVFLLLPSDNEFHGVSNEYYFLRCSFHALFWCQTVYLVYVIVQQCQSDIIFVDWECPRRKGDRVPMWRLLTVANTFDRMGAKRRSSIEFSLILVAFFMIGVGQHKNAYPQPNFYNNGGDESQSNLALSFSNTVLIWVAVWVSQLLWRFCVYERMIEEPHSTKFVDLCTVCNISVFIMVENNKGYYLHCKSPYQSAECSMEELLDNLKREGNGLTMERGLDGSAGCQTFNLFVSDVFRHQLSKIYNYGRPSQGHYFSRSDDTDDPKRRNEADNISLARFELNLFLQKFINQQPSPTRDGLRYIVREPWLAERLLNVTPADFRSNAESKCILCPDNKLWLSATFLGIELDLFIHDVLTYNAANMAFDNAGISIFLTYLMHLLRTNLRSWFGTKNLSNKSFIDATFLS